MPKLLTSECLLRMIRNGEIVVVQGLCFPVSKLLSRLSCCRTHYQDSGFLITSEVFSSLSFACFEMGRLIVVQGFIFTKDVFSSSSLFFACFDMEGLFVLISRLSFDYVAWGGAIVCSKIFLIDWLSVLRFFCVLFARCYFGHIYCFLYHISLLSLLNMLLSRLFRMGESDYLDDNPMKKHFSGKEISMFSFILRWDVRL